MSAPPATDRVTAGAARVLLAAPTDAHVRDIRALLVQMGHDTRWAPLEGSFVDASELHGYDLVVVDGGEDDHTGQRACARVRAATGETFIPVVYVSRRGDDAARWRSLELGADAHLCRPLDRVDLMARVKALLRIKALQDRLSRQNEQIVTMHQELKHAYHKLDQELKLAQRLQKSFLPQSLPDVGPVRFSVRYHMCGRVGGDFYDVFRLDEHHVGFYVADAVGHGVPAALLTVFVKKGIRTKHIQGNSYRIVPPGEALSLLNSDLLAHELDESPFISMFYGLLNTQTLKLRYSRAGHPYPVHLSGDETPGMLDADGPLLGVMPAELPEATVQLHPGDKLLVYTDGIDGVQWDDHPTGVESFVRCVYDHRDGSAEDLLRRVCAALFGGEPEGDIGVEDDLTLLALEVRTDQTS